MELRRGPLHAEHAERDAAFTDFGGWEMPVTFDSIQIEHAAVREAVGLFDVSHMGEIAVDGPDAIELCQRLTTNDVAALELGDAQYSTIVDEDGVILDDTMLYRLGEERILFIPNAGKDEMMVERWETHRDEWSLDADVANQTESFGMLAVQGPDAVETLTKAGVEDHEGIDRNTIAERTVGDSSVWCARTGYTGEDGFELLVPWDETPDVDAAIDGQRCGLGARDTLRLEMGYALAGNEFDAAENPRTPIEAGLAFVVDFDARPKFVGYDDLLEQREEGPAQRLVGLRMIDRGIPRTGYAVTDGTGDVIGEVTSGTMSPTLNEPIGLAYIDTDYSAADTEVAVQIRDAERMARIVSPPFLGSR